MYFHSPYSNYAVVHCLACTQPLISVYDPCIRDTCQECGGESKVARSRAVQRAHINNIETLYGSIKR